VTTHALLLAGLLAAPPAAPSRDPVAELGWVPAGELTLSHATGDGVAFLTYARGTLGVDRPVCLDRLAGPGVEHVTFSRYVGDKGVNATRGLSGDRDAVEACAAQVFERLTGHAVSYERDGAITRATSGAGELYLAWRDDGWFLFHHDRAWVEALLRRPSAPTLAPALRTFLKRVSLAEPYWWLYPGDLTGKLLGIPSKAVLMRVAKVAGAPALNTVWSNYASASGRSRPHLDSALFLYTLTDSRPARGTRPSVAVARGERSPVPGASTPGRSIGSSRTISCRCAASARTA